MRMLRATRYPRYSTLCEFRRKGGRTHPTGRIAGSARQRQCLEQRLRWPMPKACRRARAALDSLRGQAPSEQHLQAVQDPIFDTRRCVMSTGLYLNPPDNAMVLSCRMRRVRSRRSIALSPRCRWDCYVEGYTHDYIVDPRNEPTLFAGFDVARQGDRGKCSKRHRHQESNSRRCASLTARQPPELDIHLVVDLCDPQAPEGPSGLIQKTALPSSLHANFASWLNQVERWSRLISQRPKRDRSTASLNSSRRCRKLYRFTIQCLLFSLHLGRDRRSRSSTSSPTSTIEAPFVGQNTSRSITTKPRLSSGKHCAHETVPERQSPALAIPSGQTARNGFECLI